ncbi:MAG: ABC transporter permease [Microbacteriaceae bacterium]|nr:ABC transporter permease [Microbacteriaceae bacterium]
MSAATASPTGTVAIATRPARRLGTFARFVRQPVVMTAASFLVLLVLFAYLGPFVLPIDPATQTKDVLQGPSLGHWFGTDEFGRDIFARVLVGARASIEISLGAAAFAAVIGVLIGLVAGYVGGLLDGVFMRILDVVLALPEVVLALVIVAVLGNTTGNLILAIGIAFVPVFARVTRASVLGIRERDFVVASRAMGALSGDTMFRTILPNVVGPIIVQFIITAAIAVIASAGLGFLGLGPAAPTPSWGGMLQTAKSFIYQAPWYAAFPGIALILTVLCLDRIGDGLRSAMGLQSAGPREQGAGH